MKVVLITSLMCDVEGVRGSEGYLQELRVGCVKDVFGSWISRKAREDGDLKSYQSLRVIGHSSDASSRGLLVFRGGEMARPWNS